VKKVYNLRLKNFNNTNHVSAFLACMAGILPRQWIHVGIMQEGVQRM